MRAKHLIYRRRSPGATVLSLTPERASKGNREEKRGETKSYGVIHYRGREEALNAPMTHHQCLNIHAEELGTMEALSYSLCFCKKKHTTVPLRWNINSSH